MTLSVVMLTSVLAFSLVSGSVMHIRFVSSDNDRQAACQLAESAISATIDRLAQDPTFGASRLPQDNLFLVQSPNGGITWATAPPAKPGSFATVSFSTTASIPFSTNNLQGLTASQGCLGRTVPHGCAHLVAVARCGSLQETVEAMVGVPPFPYALACSGRLQSLGTLDVSSVAGDAHISAQTLDNLGSGALLPGNIVSNSTAPDAVTLAPAHITGTVEAVGGITLSPGTKVDGSVLPHHDPVYLPSINVNVQLLRAGEFPNVGTVTGGGGDVHLSGLNQSGSLTVDGDLYLAQAVVWVNGDLDVKGGLRGQGALFVAGSTRIESCSNLQSDDVACIVSSGDVTLGGKDQHSSYFQGIIYTSGNLNANSVTVLGSAIANASDSKAGNITLQDARFVMDAEYSQMAFGQAIPGNNPNATFLQFNAGTPSSAWNLGILPMGPGGNIGPLGGPTRVNQNSVFLIGGGTPVLVNVPVTVQPAQGPPVTVTVAGVTVSIDALGTPDGQQQIIAAVHDYVKAQAPVGEFGSPAWDEQLFDQTAADIPVQVQDVIERLGNNPFQSTQTVNTNGVLFSIGVNQFIDLADQMQVLYQAPLDSEKPLGI
ncbi:MAG: hypothetical protein ACYCW6_03680 [Candidatus Xenobia bacterium]